MPRWVRSGALAWALATVALPAVGCGSARGVPEEPQGDAPTEVPGAAVVADAPAARPEGGRGGGTRYPDLTAVAEAASQSVVSLAI